MPTTLSLTKQLLIDIEQLSLSDKDLVRAGQHVLDWVACASLGKLSSATDAYQYLVELDGAGKCTAIGGQACTLQNAVQHNGALGNVLEMDDIHRSSILHPGPVIVPVALAVAEQFDCSIKEFLIAIIKGYELTMRMGEAIGRSHYRYFHNTATCGVLGAAIAAASLLKLSEEQTLWALGNAGSKTGGLWQMRNEKVATKQWHNAETARTGMMAALLAKQNLTGPEYILEGPQGVFNAMSEDAEPTAFIAKSSQWRIYDCSFKPWPACRHAHPAIDVMSELLISANFSLDEIVSVEVSVYKDAQIFCDRLNPKTDLQAKFSIQHALAAILLWGEPQLEHYESAAYQNAECTALRERIHLIEDQELETDYPHHFGAKCKVILKDGQCFSHYQRDTLGDPEKPLSQEQLKAKATMLLSKSAIRQVRIEQLCQFDWLQSNSIKSFSTLLTDPERN